MSRNECRVHCGSAIAFAISLLAYLALTDLPDLTTTQSQTIAFYQDSGPRARSLVGG